jgi:DNA-binding NarL/FixJ family response regulator
MYDERVYAERALRSGASGYLMKPASTVEVLQAAETVADGGLHLSSQMTPLVVQETQNTDVE